jgi:hypothetical protein
LPLESSVADVVVNEWQQAMIRSLTTHMQAAAQAGQSVGGLGSALTPAMERLVVDALQVQFQFLARFRLVIQSNADYQRGLTSRAESYANSISVPYWRGATKMLPLPAMPREGTICLGNCGCAWDIVTVDEERGDYDCRWIRQRDDSCSTCIARESEWSPLRIRQGALA